MRKTKFVLIILLSIFFIPFVVNAETCNVDKVSIDSITIEEVSDHVVEIDEATVNDKDINLNLSMLDVGDSIEYKVVFKNRDKEDYKLDKIGFDSSSKYIDYNISSKDDSDIIKANSNKAFYLKVKYANEVSDEDFNSRTFSDTQTMTVHLSAENKTASIINILKNPILKNPKTGNMAFLIIILILLISGISFMLVMKKEYTKVVVLIIGTSIIIPFTVYAICEVQIKVNSSIKIERKPTNVCLRTQAEDNKISVGDIITIDTESFYVMNTDDNETTLLSLYNLYVGGKLTKTCTSGDCATIDSNYVEISENDDKYGLQSGAAKAYTHLALPADHSSAQGISSTTYGSVPFSGTNYWDNSVCQYLSGFTMTCEENRGLLSEYANSSNLDGATTFASPYPYVYKGDMATNKPSITRKSGCVGGGGVGCGSNLYAQNNGYTIDYYVDQYANKLKDLGSISTIKSRLLTKEEAESLSTEIRGAQSSWVGSAYDYYLVYYISYSATGYGSNTTFQSRIGYSAMYSPTAGVRPVIIVKTIDIMPNCIG